MLQELDKKLQFIIDEAKRRFGVKLRNLDRSRFKEDVRMFLDIYNRSMAGTWGFTPLSEGEIEHASAGLRQLIVPELTASAEVDGKMVGAVFGLLDYNPRIKRIDGRLFPFGFLRLLWNKRAIPLVRLVSTNVVPEFQKWGLGLVLMSKLLPDALAYGIQGGGVLLGVGEQSLVQGDVGAGRRQAGEELADLRCRRGLRGQRGCRTPCRSGSFSPF